jgi:hypothetical protein
MYSLNDKHIDFILNDIGARGVKTEDLQYNLLDHICCIIENELEENGDFEQFYRRTISKFYKKELKELEDETQLLLTFKHYYTMKKTMIIGGFTSALLMLFGTTFKVMHWPGANIMLIIGMATLSLVFIPVMFTLKLKEKKEKRDRVVLIFGLFVSVFLLISSLFKLMHWPYGGAMGTICLATLLFLFLPVYLFTGLRNPDAKVNTIVTSILIIAGSSLLLILPNRGPSMETLNASLNQMKNEEKAVSDLRAIFKADSSKLKYLPVYEKLMASADLLKDAVAKSISGTNYKEFLQAEENTKPHVNLAEPFHQMPERIAFIEAVNEFETATGAKLYFFDGYLGENPERRSQMDHLMELQPRVKEIMELICNTQSRACLEMMR